MQPNTNNGSVSTTFGWKYVKLAQRPKGHRETVPKARRWYQLPLRDWRKATTVTIKYRGGSEAWVEVTARGSMGRFPGHVPIVDVLAEVTCQHWRYGGGTDG